MLLIFFLLIAINLIPLQRDFLGGGLNNYLNSPYLWSWANFDGEHYLAIAREGYKPLTYFYFPLYPTLLYLFVGIFGKGFVGYLYSGLFISHVSFFIGLVGFWKLMLLDFKENIAKLTIMLLLLFPTSFYFGSVYTESLFFALVIWSFYFARKRNWLCSALLASLASATRVTGVVMPLAIFVEYLFQGKKATVRFWLKSVLVIVLSISGFLIYTFYLNQKTGDPLTFFHNVSIFGQQRSSSFVALPQVFYRYIFKIIPNLTWGYFPQVFVTFLETLTAFVFLILSLVSFFKLRLSYAAYLTLGYLIPTLSGSFSSLPRYVLVLFPGFILMSLYLSKKGKIFKFVFLFALFLCFGISTTLFTRGFWVS